MPEERITVGHLDRIDAVMGWDVIEGEWRPVRHQLGIKSFGVNAWAGTLIAIHDPSVVRSAVAVEDGTAILAVGTPIGEKFEVEDYEKRMLGPSA